VNISENDLHELLTSRASRASLGGLDELLDRATRTSRPQRPMRQRQLLAASVGVTLLASIVVAITLLTFGPFNPAPSFGPGLAGEPTSSIGPTPSPAVGDIQPTPLASCPVTVPGRWFVPPSGYPAVPPSLYGKVWYGSANLWTMLSPTGDVWSGLPRDAAGLTQKTLWWSQSFDLAREPSPAIAVAGTRLDVAGPTFVAASPGTSVEADFGTAMLVGVLIPTSGCWKITATYRGDALNYVVWVAAK